MSKENKKSSTTRPEIQGESKFIIETLLERGIYKTSTEIVTQALNLLFDKQMEEDSIKQRQERPDYSDVFHLQADVVAK